MNSRFYIHQIVSHAEHPFEPFECYHKDLAETVTSAKARTFDEAYCTSGFCESGLRTMLKSTIFEKQTRFHGEQPRAPYCRLVNIDKL